MTKHRHVWFLLSQESSLCFPQCMSTGSLGALLTAYAWQCFHSVKGKNVITCNQNSAQPCLENKLCLFFSKLYTSFPKEQNTKLQVFLLFRQKVASGLCWSLIAFSLRLIAQQIIHDRALLKKMERVKKSWQPANERKKLLATIALATAQPC